MTRSENRGPPEGAESPADGDKKAFLLRLPEPLMRELRSWANHELRSLNGHIAYLLREAVKEHKGDSKKQS
jgi:hypothetical protein